MVVDEVDIGQSGRLPYVLVGRRRSRQEKLVNSGTSAKSLTNHNAASLWNHLEARIRMTRGW